MDCRKFFLPVFAALGLGLTGAAQGVPLSVVNPGFEDTTGSLQIADEFSFGPLPGWDLYDPNNITGGGAGPGFFIGTLEPTPPVFFTAGAPEEDRVGIAFNFAGTVANVAGGDDEYGFVQTLGDTLQANTSYTLQVEIGNIASGNSLDGDFFNLDGFPGYRVDLLAGGVSIAQDLNTLAGAIPEGDFATSTIVFDSGANPAQLGQALGIRLVNLNIVDPSDPNTAAADREVDFDDVRLDAAAVPEPMTLALLLPGLLAGARRAGRA